MISEILSLLMTLLFSTIGAFWDFRARHIDMILDFVSFISLSDRWFQERNP